MLMKNHPSSLGRCLLLVLLLCGTIAVKAQTYSVSYNNQTVEQVIQDLRQRTGYQFVYQKQVVEGAPRISCDYRGLDLRELLNRVLLNGAGIDYEIVKRSIILKKAQHRARNNFYKKNVSGVVVDENDEPLAGVVVRQVGARGGATTDADGQFTILVEGTHSELEFSYLGYQLRQVAMPRKEPFIRVRLEPNEQQLSEVLVTGYQNIKRENAVGSYQTISAKKLDSHYTGTLTSRLEGQVPGLVAYNNGTGKTGEEQLTIRGVSSFSARTNPLVVVDGLPIEGSLETVNPYDIETINVLKDASAASIYGARASNGVIVITTKRAHQEKLVIDVNADLTISEKQTYGNRQWASVAQLLDLEERNFNHVLGDESAYAGLLSDYQTNPHALSLASRLMMGHHTGDISDADYQSQMAQWRTNDYRSEWRDAMLRTRVLQQYNVALRSQGKKLNSNLVFNYKGDNLGIYRENDRTFNMGYQGDAAITKWLDMSFGLNVISERSRTHSDGTTENYLGINGFAPYLSLYNADGSRAALEGTIYLQEPALLANAYGFKNAVYNLLDERDMNFLKGRRTNIRSYAHATFKILPELNVSTKFQYEDISYKGEAYHEPNSYYVRSIYNIATASDGTHYLPEGGILKTNHQTGDYYTFRAQANYDKTFLEKHAVSAIAGFEYRQTHNRYLNDVFFGYDDQTQTNQNRMMNLQGWMNDFSSALGANYSAAPYAPTDADYQTTDVLHRFYSYYFTANYTYDARYAAQFSYRVDKADLFGADPKFRGRPLWSVGASWNMHNESWMKPISWIDILKLRASYGVTGNIDSSVSSYLTAAIAVSDVTGQKYATLNTPPNEDLRWEKTATWNAGVDFSFLHNRISGALDFYVRNSSDLLTLTDVDPTTGWTSLNINNGKARNTGVELQLNAAIIQPQTMNDLGVNIGFGIAYNKNKVTRADHDPTSGYEALGTLHEGRPVNALYSYRFAGVQTDDEGSRAMGWYDHEGNIHSSDIASGEFSKEDIVYSGGLDPKLTWNLTPEITFRGFSLSGMFTFYGGHYMRCNVENWTPEGNYNGYGTLNSLEAVPAAYLDYWNQTSAQWAAVPNGYPSYNMINAANAQFIDQTVQHADYLKLRYITLGYDFPKRWISHLGIGSLRLRVQMNNIFTWARNRYDIDPEANDPVSGIATLKAPHSYTMSLAVGF